MASSNLGYIFSRAAAADLSAKQFYAMTVDSSSEIAVAGAAANIAGILQNKPVAGVAASVQTDRISKAVAGALVAAGAFLEIDSSGRFITLASGISVAQALSGAAAADDLFTVLLHK